MIAEGVLAIEMGCSARDIAESIHPHPTLSETVAFANESYFGTATEIYKPRRGWETLGLFVKIVASDFQGSQLRGDYPATNPFPLITKMLDVLAAVADLGHRFDADI